MLRPGIVFGSSVALGVLLCSTVLPLSPGRAAFATAAVTGLAARYAWAGPLVPAGLGFLRESLRREVQRGRSVDSPRRFEGDVHVVGRVGSGALLEAGSRRLLLSEPPAELPGPGESFRALLRIDPLRSRAEPSAFRVERWAAGRGIHGRTRLLGDWTALRPRDDVRSRLRRAAERLRTRSASRLGTDDTGELLVALLLGDRRGLDTDEREAFRRAGLAHVLALSGMHVGILALGAGALLRCLGLRGRWSLPPLLAFLAIFAFVTGARPPILRACGTSALALVGFHLGRRSDALHALGLLAGALLLLNPSVLDDAGFRLSFLASGLLALAARRKPGKRRRRLGWTKPILDAVGLSTIVTLGTLPEIASAFGTVSLLSPITNLFAGPIAAAALGWAGLAAAIPGPDALVTRLAEAANVAAFALLRLARFASRLPGGEVTLPAPGPATAALGVALAGALALGRRPGRVGQVVLGALTAGALVEALPPERLTFLDAGQGDAILIEGGGGAALVDTGPPPFEGATPFLPRAVRRRTTRPLEAIVLTHGHADHVGGAGALLESHGARTLHVPRRSAPPPSALEELVDRAGRARTKVVEIGGLSEARDLLEGRMRVHSAWPGPVPPPETTENELSLVTRWTRGPLTALLPGDLGFPGEESLLRGDSELRATILLAGHHGSRGSTGAEWLERVNPRLVVVSCGTGNPHGHPHEALLERVRDAGAALLRTDRDGTIFVTATAFGFRLRWTRDFPPRADDTPAIPLPTREGFS